MSDSAEDWWENFQREQAEKKRKATEMADKVENSRTVHLRVGDRGGAIRHIMIHKSPKRGERPDDKPYQVSRFDEKMQPWGHRYVKDVRSGIHHVWDEHGQPEVVKHESRLVRAPLLVESVKGGLKAQDHEIRAQLVYHTPGEQGSGPQQVSKSLTHDEKGNRIQSFGDAVRDHKHILADPDKRPTLGISIRNRNEPEWKSVTRMAVTRRPADGAHPESGLPVVRSSDSSTSKDHERQGWATTLYNHVGRKLKRAGLHLDHDWGAQSTKGQRWAQRTTGQQPHRTARSDESISKSMEKNFPHLGEHHPKIKKLAHSVLDQGAGFYDFNHIRTFRRVAKRMNLPPMSTRDVRRIFSHHGGHPVTNEV